MLKRVVFAILTTAGLVATAGAHHSFAVFFDEKKMVKIEGVVSDFQFRNPHGVIRLNVKAGDVEEIWRAETNSPSILERRGWKRDSLKAGDVIRIEGWPARDGSRYLRMRVVTRADGTPVGRPFDAPEQK